MGWQEQLGLCRGAGLARSKCGVDMSVFFKFHLLQSLVRCSGLSGDAGQSSSPVSSPGPRYLFIPRYSHSKSNASLAITLFRGVV